MIEVPLHRLALQVGDDVEGMHAASRKWMVTIQE